MATISINNLARAIYESTKDEEGGALDGFIKNSVILIKEKHLLGKANQILKVLEKIIDGEKGIVRAEINSRSEITDKLKNELEKFIKERYGAEEAVLNYEENLNLLGGMKIKVADEVINVTLRNKINQLQDYLIKN